MGKIINFRLKKLSFFNQGQKNCYIKNIFLNIRNTSKQILNTSKMFVFLMKIEKYILSKNLFFNFRKKKKSYLMCLKLVLECFSYFKIHFLYNDFFDLG